MFQTDPYTRQMRKIANHEPMDPDIARNIISGIQWICDVHGIDAILSVPPKPGEIPKFKDFISKAADFCRIENMDNAVFCCKPYPPLWPMTQQERREAVFDAFWSRRGYDYKKRILVLDDIVSTGVTFEEVAQELLLAGAKELFFVALAMSQSVREGRGI